MSDSRSELPLSMSLSPVMPTGTRTLLGLGSISVAGIRGIDIRSLYFLLPKVVTIGSFKLVPFVIVESSNILVVFQLHDVAATDVVGK